MKKVFYVLLTITDLLEKFLFIVIIGFVVAIGAGLVLLGFYEANILGLVLIIMGFAIIAGWLAKAKENWLKPTMSIQYRQEL